MSRIKIPSRFLDTTVNIYRQSTTKDDIGEFDVTEITEYANVPALVRPEKSELEFELQGKAFYQTDACYINRYDPSLRKPLGGDYVLDTETAKKYLVLQVENQKSFRKSITEGTHIKLIMRYIGLVETVKTQTLTTKGRIA